MTTSQTDLDAAYPPLTEPQLARLRARAERVRVAVGDVLFTAGDTQYDLILIESGEVEIVRAATPDAPSSVVARHGAGRFVGELNMLTGQAAYLTARVSVAGEISRIPYDRFRRLMAEDGELSDLILRAFMARRDLLRTGEGARSIEVLGHRSSAAALALRNWAARAQIPHLWLDIDTPEGQALAHVAGQYRDRSAAGGDANRAAQTRHARRARRSDRACLPVRAGPRLRPGRGRRRARRPGGRGLRRVGRARHGAASTGSPSAARPRPARGSRTIWAFRPA